MGRNPLEFRIKDEVWGVGVTKDAVTEGLSYFLRKRTLDSHYTRPKSNRFRSPSVPNFGDPNRTGPFVASFLLRGNGTRGHGVEVRHGRVRPPSDLVYGGATIHSGCGGSVVWCPVEDCLHVHNWLSVRCSCVSLRCLRPDP